MTIICGWLWTEWDEQEDKTVSIDLQYTSGIIENVISAGGTAPQEFGPLYQTKVVRNDASQTEFTLGYLDCEGTASGTAYVDECDFCCDGLTNVVCSHWYSWDNFTGVMDCNAECHGPALIGYDPNVSPSELGVVETCCTGDSPLIECCVDSTNNGICDALDSPEFKNFCGIYEKDFSHRKFARNVSQKIS